MKKKNTEQLSKVHIVEIVHLDRNSPCEVKWVEEQLKGSF